jgi:hypothetical protein
MLLGNIQESQVGLKLNETHQLEFYADDVNLLGYNLNNVKKTLIEIKAKN